VGDAATIPLEASPAAKRRHRRKTPRPAFEAAPVRRILLDSEAAAVACSVSRAFFLSLVDSGRAPRGVRFGRRRLWTVTELKEWAAGGCPRRGVEVVERER
jgi:predicted DNA-binding transcriptional regulator AlpA